MKGRVRLSDSLLLSRFAPRRGSPRGSRLLPPKAGRISDFGFPSDFGFLLLLPSPPARPILAPVIALLDYGSGNLRSVQKALLKVGAEVRVVQRPEAMADARAAVLPGVGAFDDCIRALQEQGLLEAARQFIRSGRPFLGICVGYQALFEKSDEFNSCAAGLGLFPGKVVRFLRSQRDESPPDRVEPDRTDRPECPVISGHRRRQLCVFRP